MHIYLQAVVNLSIIQKCSATREEGCKTSWPNIYNDDSAIIPSGQLSPSAARYGLPNS